MSAVLVSHPHAAAVSCGFAACLAREGKLAAFVTGVAVSAETELGHLAGKLAARRPVVANRIIAGVPPARLISLAPVEMLARGFARALNAVSSGRKSYDSLFVAHDAAVACIPWPAEASTVYAYEDGALMTFRRARHRGLKRVWDLPALHYLTVEDIQRDETRRWPDALLGTDFVEPPWKRRRKDGELALATQISVASRFTRASLERIGVSVPIVVLPYGFPTDQFVPKTTRPEGRFRVLSVGSHDLRKGTPYLLEAWRKAEIPHAELHLIGPLRLAKPFLDRYAGLFRHSPHLPRAALGAHYAAADVLAFPTLGDGFGLVIQEAMSCATPVITTPCGGGPECISDGIDGWLIPPRDVDALVERLRYAAGNRDRTFAIGQAARARAERWTWTDARGTLVTALAT